MQNGYDFWMKWNDRLRQARDAANVRNADIARALKVSNPTVNGWMTGDTVNIEARNLLPLCKMLGVSPFWVMFADDEEAEMAILPDTASIPAMDTLRLLALFAQATDDGRRRIMDLAGTVKKRSAE